MGIREILPTGTVSVEWGGDRIEPALYEAEAALVARASPSRRLEFARGRTCARRALSELGLPAGPVLAGPGRSPRWPPDVVGSITHCENYCAAVVAKKGRWVAIGVDAELHAPLPAGVLNLVTVSEERARLRRIPAPTCWDAVLFSAKESVFKAWFPMTGQWLEFADVVVTIFPHAGSFSADVVTAATPRATHYPTHVTGKFIIRNGRVHTAVAIDASQAGT